LELIKGAEGTPLIQIGRYRVIADAAWVSQPERLRAVARAAAVADSSGRAQLALDLSERQLSLSHPEEDRWWVVQAKNRIAMMHYFLTRPSEALARLDSLSAELRDDERDMIGVVEGNRALILRSAGRYDEAIQSLTLAERVNREYGRGKLICSNMLTRGNILLEVGETESALEVFEQLEQFAFVLSESRAVAMAKGSQAITLQRMRRYKDAMQANIDAARMFAGLDDHRNSVNVRGNVASLLYHMGHLNEAESELAKVAEDALAIGWTDTCIVQLCNLVDLFLDRGDVASARELLVRVNGLSKADDELSVRLFVASVRARLLMHEGRTDETIHELTLATSMADDHQSVEHTVRLHSQLAEAELMAGQVEEAMVRVQVAHDAAVRRLPPDIEGLLQLSLVWTRCALSTGDHDMLRTLALDMRDLCNKLNIDSIESARLDREAREFLRQCGV
jgi:tetratricopeptide (TPR) repeat protein